MTMANIAIAEVPQPKYKGTIVCPNCYAEYKDGGKWVWGRYEGTSTQFNVSFRVPDNRCPFCLAAKEEKG